MDKLHWTDDLASRIPDRNDYEAPPKPPIPKQLFPFHFYYGGQKILGHSEVYPPSHVNTFLRTSDVARAIGFSTGAHHTFTEANTVMLGENKRGGIRYIRIDNIRDIKAGCHGPAALSVERFMDSLEHLTEGLFATSSRSDSHPREGGKVWYPRPMEVEVITAPRPAAAPCPISVLISQEDCQLLSEFIMSMESRLAQMKKILGFINDGTNEAAGDE